MALGDDGLNHILEGPWVGRRIKTCRRLIKKQDSGIAGPAAAAPAQRLLLLATGHAGGPDRPPPAPQAPPLFQQLINPGRREDGRGTAAALERIANVAGGNCVLAMVGPLEHEAAGGRKVDAALAPAPRSCVRSMAQEGPMAILSKSCLA